MSDAYEDAVAELVELVEDAYHEGAYDKIYDFFEWEESKARAILRKILEKL